MGYTLSCKSSSVAIKVSSVNSQAGTLQGSTTLDVTDTSTGRVVSSPTINASGNISENGTRVAAGSGGGFTLSVTWSPSGTATGSASGSYSGTNLDTNVPVAVDHGGKAHHKKKGAAGA